MKGHEDVFEKTWIAKEHILRVRQRVNWLRTESLLKRKRKVETERTVQWRKIANQEMEHAYVTFCYKIP